MSDDIIITAKTVEEALAKAETEFAGKGELSYEIVEMPKKGFFGIGEKPAKIKVTLTAEEKTSVKEEKSADANEQKHEPSYKKESLKTRSTRQPLLMQRNLCSHAKNQKTDRARNVLSLRSRPHLSLKNRSRHLSPRKHRQSPILPLYMQKSPMLNPLKRKITAMNAKMLSLPKTT